MSFTGELNHARQGAAALVRERRAAVALVHEIQTEVERLAVRIEGVLRTHNQMRALAAYQPPIREDSRRYDAAAGSRLAATVQRRMGLELDR